MALNQHDIHLDLLHRPGSLKIYHEIMMNPPQQMLYILDLRFDHQFLEKQSIPEFYVGLHPITLFLR